MEDKKPPNIVSLKTVEINYEDKKYICKIQTLEELINVHIFLDNELKYNGNIFLEKIQVQIKAFFDYELSEIFDEINQLKENNFSIVKESNKLKLKIKFMILRRKKYLFIDLNDDLIKYYTNIIKEKDTKITELNEKGTEQLKSTVKKDNIISELNEKINVLENQLKNNNIKSKLTKDETQESKNDNLSNDFNIKLKNPIHTLNFHTDYVYCLTVLNDGRLVSGSGDHSIIIYNKTTYQPDLIIKEHKDTVRCITQLSSGILATCSYDKTIKLFNIKGNNYEIIQNLNYHTDYVTKIIELKNKYLASCSYDKSIIFYYKDNSKYKKDFQTLTNGPLYSIAQIKENEICFTEYINKNNAIHFFDLNERKIVATISNISKSNLSSLIMISKDLAIICGENKISIINVNQYKLIREIKVHNSSWIKGVCMLNKTTLLTGDDNAVIRQWKIKDDNLVLFSKKEKTHDNSIYALLNMGDGHIASGSYDKLIKIW